jgi:cytochrome c oxidase assembly factor 2
VENEGEQRKEGSALEENDDEGESRTLVRIQGSKPKRECPVPKPGGLVGEILGFNNASSSEGDDRKGSKPP